MMPQEKKKEPLISVVMPVYNAEKTLANSVASILTQAYSALEVILVDDGSRDQSLKICRELADMDDRVQVIAQPNSGPALARNTALKVMTGDYVLFVDSDDFLSPDAIPHMMNAMGDNELVLAHYFFDMGKVSSPRGLLKGTRKVGEMEFLLELMHRPGSFYFSALWNKLYRAQIIRENAIEFDPFLDWGEDFAFNMTYYHHVKNGVTLLDEPVYHYVKNPGGASIRTLWRVWHSCRIKARLYQHFKALYVEKGLYESHKATIQRYIYNVTLAD